MILDAPIHLLPAEGGSAIYVSAWIFTGVILAITALILFFQYYGEGRRRSKKPVKADPPKPEPTEEPSEENTEEAPIPEEPTPDEPKES